MRTGKQTTLTTTTTAASTEATEATCAALWRARFDGGPEEVRHWESCCGSGEDEWDEALHSGREDVARSNDCGSLLEVSVLKLLIE